MTTVSTDHTILLFYKFAILDDLPKLLHNQKELWQQLGLTGRLIIAEEGINGTLEGRNEDTQKYMDHMRQDPRFADLWFKTSPGTGAAFGKASIKVRAEVCTLGRPDLNPLTKTAKYISHDELHLWYEGGKDFAIIDMRNDYEYAVGHFDNSLLIPNVHHFRDVPSNLSTFEALKDKPVVTFCTGGIRCEKSSGLLIEAGFTDVYQLEGGIHTYLVNHPNGYFRGKLYVFDGRVIVSFGGTTDEVIGTCKKCGDTTENFVNVEGVRSRDHYLMCQDCVLKHEDVITFNSNT
jgi:UPF0176 protein